MHILFGLHPLVVQKQTLDEVGSWTVIDGKLCREYSHQKLLESGNFSWSYNQKCRGCFLRHHALFCYVAMLTWLRSGSNENMLQYAARVHGGKWQWPIYSNYFQRNLCHTKNDTNPWKILAWFYSPLISYQLLNRARMNIPDLDSIPVGGGKDRKI